MRYVTKEFNCHCCGRKETVTVLETVLAAICKHCGAYVTLGKAVGLSGGELAVLVLVLWGLLG